jgi:glycine/D-amino acid oxidase-like deaminating enzyme
VHTDTLVVAAGIWSPAIGRMAGVPLPLVPMQHQYVITHPVPELSGRTLPNLRDPDKLVYMRQGHSLEAGPASAGEAMARAPIAAAEARITVGGYERNPRASSVSAIPSGANPTVLSFDPDHFAPLERAAIERVPALAAAGVEFGVNGLESFTPDGEFLLGPTNRLGGFWAACGFCAHGVSSAGGVGKLLAEWIVEGKPSLDLSAMSPDRFARKVIDEPWIAQEACRVYSTYYDIRSPIVGLP